MVLDPRAPMNGESVEEDYDEVSLMVTIKDGKVLLDFGKPVSWLAFAPSQAGALAEVILYYAREIEKGAQ